MKFRFGFLLAMLMLFAASCNEDLSFNPNFQGLTQFKVRLTDNPTDLEGVFIHIKKVVVIGRGEREEIELETEDQVINLLDYQNGASLEIAGAIINLEFVKEVRLVLHDDNYVVVDGEKHELKVPSGSSSGLKIKTCIDLSETNNYELLIDFDAEKSVKKTGNGRYQLKPVIRVMNEDGRCGDPDDDDDDDDDGHEYDDDCVGGAELPEWLQAMLPEGYQQYCFILDTEELCGSEEEVYRLEVFNNDELLEKVFFSMDKEYLQVTKEIALEDLPEAVTDAIADNYRQYEVVEGPAEEIVDAGNNTSYGVYLAHMGNGKLIKVIVAADGTVLCEQEKE